MGIATWGLLVGVASSPELCRQQHLAERLCCWDGNGVSVMIAVWFVTGYSCLLCSANCSAVCCMVLMWLTNHTATTPNPTHSRVQYVCTVIFARQIQACVCNKLLPCCNILLTAWPGKRASAGKLGQLIT